MVSLSLSLIFFLRIFHFAFHSRNISVQLEKLIETNNSYEMGTWWSCKLRVFTDYENYILYVYNECMQRRCTEWATIWEKKILTNGWGVFFRFSLAFETVCVTAAIGWMLEILQMQISQYILVHHILVCANNLGSRTVCFSIFFFWNHVSDSILHYVCSKSFSWWLLCLKLYPLF